MVKFTQIVAPYVKQTVDFIAEKYQQLIGSKGYIIIHNGQQPEKVCCTKSSARKHINDHKKSNTVAKLPIIWYNELYLFITMSRSKELDKFYTNPNIARQFVEIVNNLFPLNNFDLVIEPSAGSGNILHYLPKGSVGLDLEPEADNIIKQDFFKYDPGYHPILNNIKIACVGNPPFGSGYMNPLAKGFFNHAATFSELIAFIVPAKWSTSWKVQFQLDKSFNLYYSELLPKNSFILDGQPYDVPCCMQVWSKVNRKDLIDLRIRERPPTKHEDFEMFLTCDNVPKLPQVREQIKNQEYWEFALKYWGQIRVCNYDEVSPDTTTHYLFKSKKPYVRDIFEQIDWSKYVSNMGAPNVGGKSLVVKAYAEKKKELNITD